MFNLDEILKLDSFQYFRDELMQDTDYDVKFFYYDENLKNTILNKYKNVFETEKYIESIKVLLSGYSFSFALMFAKPYLYKGRSKKLKGKILNFNRYIYINKKYNRSCYPNVENIKEDVKFNIANDYKFKGIVININPFTYGNIYKRSYEYNVIYPILENNQKSLLITFENIYIILHDKVGRPRRRTFPLSLNNLSILLSVLTKNHYKNLINFIFDVLGENKYLLKDVKQYLIDNNYHFLVPITFNELSKHFNFNEYFNVKYKNTYNINFNKGDISYNYLLFKVYSLIKAKYINKFANDFKNAFSRNKKVFIEYKYNFSKKYDVLRHILLYVYFNNNINNDIKDINVTLEDYLLLCKQNRSEINISRILNIAKLHDEEVKKQLKIKEKKLKYMKNNKFVYTNNDFNNLISNMPSKYTLIDNEYDLYKEGEYQHNCVYSYKDRILRYDCIIFKYEIDNDRHYTIEIRKNNKGVYELFQIKNRFNQEPDIDIYNEVKNDINIINTKIKWG